MYVHSAQPYSATRVGSGNASGGGPDSVVHGRANGGGGGGSTGKKGGLGNTIAGIAFRGMGAGVDSMGGHHAYSMDELDTTTSTLNVDKKYGGSIDEAGYTSKVVHMGPGHAGQGGARGVVVHQQSVDDSDVDLERAESYNGHESTNQKSFVPTL